MAVQIDLGPRGVSEDEAEVAQGDVDQIDQSGEAAPRDTDAERKLIPPGRSISSPHAFISQSQRIPHKAAKTTKMKTVKQQGNGSSLVPRLACTMGP